MMKSREIVKKTMWICRKEDCGKRFNCRPSRWRHEQKCQHASSLNHGNVPTAIKLANGKVICSACKTIYLWMESFSRHKKSSRADTQSACQKKREKNSSNPLVKHPRPHKCRSCGKGFREPAKLARHRNSMHKEETSESGSSKNIYQSESESSQAFGLWIATT